MSKKGASGAKFEGPAKALVTPLVSVCVSIVIYNQSSVLVVVQDTITRSHKSSRIDAVKHHANEPWHVPQQNDSKVIFKAVILRVF